MKGLLKKIGALMARMRAAVSQVALIAVRGVDGAISWTWQVVKGLSAGPAAAVEYEPAAPDPVESVEDASLLDIGGQAVAAAQSLVRRQGVPAGTDPIVRRWLEGLDRGDLFIVAEADPIAVGRHVAGMDVLRSVEGLALRRPEPEADLDRERLRKRRIQEARGDRERTLAAMARRDRQEKVEWEAALTPAPSLTPAGW